MVTYDDTLKLYFVIRRDGTYSGSTPEEALLNADKAEQARIAMHPRKIAKPRYTLITGQLEIRPG